MTNIISELSDRRAQTLARLAALQRLKELAIAGDRASMFASIERLIDAETRLLRKAADSKSKSSDETSAAA